MPLTLTDREVVIVKKMIHDEWQEAIGIAREWGWFDPEGLEEKTSCERVLDALDLERPWGASGLEFLNKN